MKKLLLSSLLLLFIKPDVIAQVPVFSFANPLSSAGQEQTYGVVSDASGNSYITGNFSGTVDFNPSVTANNLTATGFTDIFVAKYNSTGQYQWAIGYGGSSVYNTGTDIAIDATGNIYVTGYFSDVVDFDAGPGTATLSATTGNTDVFLAKYNSSGQLQWVTGISGAGNETANALVINPAGEILLGGNYDMTTDFDGSASTFTMTSNGAQDIFVAKYSSSGNFISAISVGGAGNDVCKDICVDGSGSFCITGGFDQSVDFDPSAASTLLIPAPGFNASDAFLAKYDNTNSLQWAFAIGNSTNDQAYSVAADQNGDFYTAGFYTGTVDFDPSVSTSYTTTSAGGNDLFLAKYNSSGNFVWANTFGAAGNEHASALCTDIYNNVLMTGSFENTINFNPSLTATLNLTSNGFQDIFLTKYTSNGSLIWGFELGGTGADFAFSVHMPQNGTKVYCGGLYQATVDFDPSASTTTLTCAGTEDAFVAKYDDLTVGIKHESESVLKTTMYPNPFTDAVTIDSARDCKVELFNLTGQKLFEQELKAGKKTIDLTHLSNGIYFLKSSNDKGQNTSKIVKQ